MITFHKYSGAGNDFVVVDGRALQEQELSRLRSTSSISALCARKGGFEAADGRVGADGFMLLLGPSEPGTDFQMEFYNPDGSGGMMCGNGGRCMVAFAHSVGIQPSSPDGLYRFIAADGLHTARVLSQDGRRKIVRLQMVDVCGVQHYDLPQASGEFLNTGTRHFVTFVEDLVNLPISTLGPAIRYAEEFAPVGTNVNFVKMLPDGSIAVRTFEKGVEDETLACGTGITASALCAYLSCPALPENERMTICVHALTDDLSVDFVCTSKKEAAFKEVHLIGPAEEIL